MAAVAGKRFRVKILVLREEAETIERIIVMLTVGTYEIALGIMCCVSVF